MTQVYFIGDSHTDAVREALLDRPRASAIAVNLHGRRDWATLNESFAFIDGAERYFSMIGGNAHNVLGLLRHPHPFDFVLPSAPGLPLDPAAEVLTYGYLAAALERMISIDLEAMKMLRAKAWFAHLESPPPIGDDAHIQEHLDPYFRGQPSPVIAPKGLRYKLWRLNSEIIATFCAANDIGFVAAPETTIDDGFLAPRFYALNATHANKAYGAELLAQAAA